ncbi:hypothetical protein [Catalinimonas alkaloidigena]|nr:hypothetical protein [Catalinimonas alkaloidigena]
MKKILFSLFCLLCTAATAQTATVVFNYERSQFNDNQPLPAGENFTLTGEVNGQVSMVEVKIYPKDANLSKAPLYRNLWKGAFSGEAQTFYLPVNYKLRDNTPYDFVINYYRRITNQELREVQRQLYTYLDAYVDQSITSNGKRVKLEKGPNEMVNDLNSVVNSSLAMYQNGPNLRFAGFSDLTRDRFRTLKGMRLDKDNAPQFDDITREVKMLLHTEVQAMLNSGLSVIADSKHVDNYPVEKTRNILTLHAGYGGVYLDGDLQDLSYGSGFNAGLTLPLGQKVYASKFWSRSEIVVGFYFKDFKVSDDRTVSGPIFKRPTYIGLGYNIFEFVSLTGGVTFLEDASTAGGFDDLANRVYVRPFLGVNVNLNLWLDLAR